MKLRSGVVPGLLTLLWMLLMAPSAMMAQGTPAASMEAKLERIRENGARSTPDPNPTEITEQEANAYVAAGNIRLPAGVQSVTFQAEPGVLVGTAQVDFDKLKAGRTSGNPLLGVFSGVHAVVVHTQARGEHGQGIVHVDSVSLDGVEIPRFVLQMFVEKYLQPKYPGIGLDTRFRLPARIDAAVVGQHRVTVVQK
jgi:hypothetical protein